MADIPNKPETRKETYLAAIAGQNVDLPPYPITREEAYLQRIAEGGSVEANPEEEPTGTLEKLKVGDGVYAVPSGGGGGTSNYNDLTNKPSINGVTLSGNKTTSDLGIDKNAVGLGNVPNVSTNDQTPTFTEASTRNNIASGEKLSVILGKIAKFFNDLKTVAFSGSYTDLSSQPQINSNTLSGNKTTSDLGINADNVMMSDGVTSVEDTIDNVYTATNATGVSGAFHYTKIGRVVVGAGEMSITQNIDAYSPIVTDLPLSETTVMGAFVAQDNGYNNVYINAGSIKSSITTRTARNNGDLMRLSCVYLARN